MRKRKARPDVPRGCRNCHGTGYVSVKDTWQNQETGQLFKIDSTMTCSCPLGAWRKEQFRKRKEEQPT